MMRKTLAILTAAAMAAGSLSAGVCVYAADDATHIYVQHRKITDGQVLLQLSRKRKWKK